jgi:hypothetical protein
VNWLVCSVAGTALPLLPLAPCRRGASVNFREHSSVHFREHSVHFREHSVHLREHSVHFKEHSDLFKEHSVHFREHSVNFREHSVLFKELPCPCCCLGRPAGEVVLSTLNNIQITLGNIQSALESNQFWSLYFWFRMWKKWEMLTVSTM